jgi:predicted Zn-ribbon and HTH transcriptional regulator
MAKPTQVERIKIILDLLLVKDTSLNIKTIQETLFKSNISISERQIYRDIADLKKSFLRDGETLKVTTQGNKKFWQIINNPNAEKIQDFDVKTYLLSRLTNPSSLDGRKNSLEKIYSLIKDNLSNSNIYRYADLQNHLENSHFYEVAKDINYQKHLDDLIWLCTSPNKITIHQYFGDAVSKYKTLTVPFDFIPLKTIYHRGSFFTAGIIDNLDQQILVLDVNQIAKNYQILDFIPKKKNLLKKVNAELENRFGVTQNMDNTVYKIELEFSSTTGLYVKEHHWHNSQKDFELLSNGNYLMTMTCGINRELVGWIFQWMGNVKIINPPELKKLYKQQLYKMNALQQGDDLVYSNIFQPK